MTVIELSGGKKLAALLPHGEAMSLLASVQECSANGIRCLASSHLECDNPLRLPDGSLPVWLGVEYAAQAMALHSRLQMSEAGGRPQEGFVAVGSKVKASVACLDELGGPLCVRADVVDATADSSLYVFVISVAECELLSGRLLVVRSA